MPKQSPYASQDGAFQSQEVPVNFQPLSKKHMHQQHAESVLTLQASIAPSSNRSKRRLSAQLPKQSPSVSEDGAAFSPRRTVLSLPIAMSLYDLKHSELFWELELDTRCLVAWSSTHIVVSFRGTASMWNAVTDMQAS